MNMQTVDIEAYFERIGYLGERRATHTALSEIQRRHIETIAFENLDPLLRRPVRLDSRALLEKLVHAGRGGYCFEHNLLVKQVLETLGFRVTGLAARVLWNVADGEVTPRTHMLLKIAIEEAIYIVDTAFSLSPTAPLLLESERVQQTPHEAFRLLENDVGFVLQAQLGGEWRSLYVFDLQPQHHRDYEMANWFVSTHPQSHFLHRLMVARAAPGRRLTLRNNEFSERTIDGGVTHRVLTDADELAQTLQGDFGIRLPDAPELEAVLTRIAQTTA